MRAFLSHSSKDKPFVEAVARVLGGAHIEIDSLTFDRGILNSEAISSALRRSDLFVMFCSSDSVQSTYIRFEAALAQELYASGKIDKILLICIDPRSFDLIDYNWKKYNIARRCGSPKTAGRLIQSALMTAQAITRASDQPFVGRSSDLDTAKDRLIDPEDQPVAVYVSGNTGVGRRTFAKKLYRDTFPSVSSILPEIGIDEFDGLEEIYIKFHSQVSMPAPLTQFSKHLNAFSMLDEEQKVGEIVALISQMCANREAVILRDHGGLLQDSGFIQPIFRKIIQRLDPFPHPPIIFIAERTPPRRERDSVRRVVFCPLTALAPDSIRQLIAVNLRRRAIIYTAKQLDELVRLSDNHPFNVNYMLGCIDAYSLDLFIANPIDLITWKNKRTFEFLESLKFTDDEVRILGILRGFPALEFGMIAEASLLEVSSVADALTTLMDKHIVETASGTYFVSPPLRNAVERNRRFDMSARDQRSAYQVISRVFVSEDTDTPVSISFVEAGVLATIQTDATLPDHLATFLLPSHLVWLAKRHYDERRLTESLRFAEEALAGGSRLSLAGIVEACRLVCLSAARLNDTSTFDFGLSKLQRLRQDNWVKGTAAFLQGFKARLDGQLPEAELFQREAYRLRPGNFSAARELAFICLNRGNILDAEGFARRAFQNAPDNPFVLDILLSTLIKLRPARPALDFEIEDLLDRLFRTSRDDGRSFFETRKAEYEMVRGDLPAAMRWIEDASGKTPHMFDVIALRAKIYEKRGNLSIVSDELEKMNRMVSRNSFDGRTNLRKFLEIRIDYLVSCRRFDEARGLLNIPGVFDEEERQRVIRSIAISEAVSKNLPK